MWDVDALMAAMSSHLMAEWMAYYKLEPFGDELIDIHFATLDAIMTSSKDKPSDPKKFRVWQSAESHKEFDPQEFFDGLKAAAMKVSNPHPALPQLPKNKSGN